MGISVKTRKMLWGMSAARCNYHNCNLELVMDATFTDDESLVGEECHIVAKSNDGPRGESTLTSEERDKYDNLILMCAVHHKLIDDQYEFYTINKIKKMKKQHEERVKINLDYDSAKIEDDKIYTTYIDKWMELARISEWDVWTSYMLGSGQPKIFKEIDKSLNELRMWLFNRIWPKRYKELEYAFENFRKVLEDTYTLFHKHSVKKDDQSIIFTEKFYHISEWNDTRYQALLKEYQAHVKLVQDIILELTRSANFICDMTRKYILKDFMLHEGVLVVTYGPVGPYLEYYTHKVEYSQKDFENGLYNGLEDFQETRKQRDLCFI